MHPAVALLRFLDSTTTWRYDRDFFADMLPKEELTTTAAAAATSPSSPPPPPTTAAKDQSLVEGIYKYERSFNFNNYLRELGVSYVLRTFAGMATPVVTISREDQCEDDKVSRFQGSRFCTIALNAKKFRYS